MYYFEDFSKEQKHSSFLWQKSSFLCVTKKNIKFIFFGKKLLFLKITFFGSSEFRYLQLARNNFQTLAKMYETIDEISTFDDEKIKQNFIC